MAKQRTLLKPYKMWLILTTTINRHQKMYHRHVKVTLNPSLVLGSIQRSVIIAYRTYQTTQHSWTRRKRTILYSCFWDYSQTMYWRLSSPKQTRQSLGTHCLMVSCCDGLDCGSPCQLWMDLIDELLGQCVKLTSLKGFLSILPVS